MFADASKTFMRIVLRRVLNWIVSVVAIRSYYLSVSLIDIVVSL